MKPRSPFQDRQPNVAENPRLRVPQREAFAALEEASPKGERELSVVLPVGCGKSGCITLTPFAFQSHRALVVAPGLNITTQLYRDFDSAHPQMFYKKCDVLSGEPYPELVEIRGDSTNVGDLEEADVVVTNIQQLQRAENRWLKSLPADFFDLIVFDEGHHNVAESWTALRAKFPQARIVNFSATPTRADGDLMEGRIVYSFPIIRAIELGYVKHLKAVVLNPRTLRYVRRNDDREIEVSLEEVRRLGEVDADFRKSIVTSKETLETIVNASIRELDRLRATTGERRLKIIASALNQEHCRQVVEAYRARGQRADYVHSKEDGEANKRVMTKLENHELDVIVQVRKLGEGFDHPHLSVAAVFSIFRSLSPFVQFVGRVMRSIKPDAPGDALNQGSVVFHAGANIARQWEDFQRYSDADQEYFDRLLPLEALDFGDGSELEVDPTPRFTDAIEVKAQTDISLQEIPLIDDPEALAALSVLRQKGYSSDEVLRAYETVPVSKVRVRQAKRASLDTRIKNAAASALHDRRMNPEGRDLDTNRLNRSNLVVLKSAIDREVNATVGRKGGQRSEFTKDELEQIESAFPAIVTKVLSEVFRVS